jgi:hypothetical protein
MKLKDSARINQIDLTCYLRRGIVVSLPSPSYGALWSELEALAFDASEPYE